MSIQNTKYISLHEASKLTDYSQEYISLLCRKGKIKGEKLGRNWFTTKEWINDYVARINKSKENNKGVICKRRIDQTPNSESSLPAMNRSRMESSSISLEREAMVSMGTS